MKGQTLLLQFFMIWKVMFNNNSDREEKDMHPKVAVSGSVAVFKGFSAQFNSKSYRFARSGTACDHR